MQALARTQIYLKKSQLSRLRTFARKKNRTVSDLIRNAVDQALETKKKAKKGRFGLDPVEKLMGKGKSEDKYLSQKVDFYLYDFSPEE